jgi:dUTP pyrophosphatase
MDFLAITKTGDVKDPTRAHDTDAGVDFFVPNDFESVTVAPNGTALINLKVKTTFPKGYALIFFDKSGVALKKNLILKGGVVDSEYTGELVLQLANVGSTESKIEPGEKIIQGILMPISLAMPIIVSAEEYADMTTNSARGENGHGSTGSF